MPDEVSSSEGGLRSEVEAFGRVESDATTASTIGSDSWGCAPFGSILQVVKRRVRGPVLERYWPSIPRGISRRI